MAGANEVGPRRKEDVCSSINLFREARAMTHTYNHARKYTLTTHTYTNPLL